MKSVLSIALAFALIAVATASASEFSLRGNPSAQGGNSGKPQGGNSHLQTQGSVKIMGKVVDNHFCKVLCQRFAMKALSKAFGGKSFGDHPTDCVKACDTNVPAK